MQSLLPDVHFLPFPYEYRCPFGVGEGMTARLSAQYIENLLDDCESGIAAPCGVIVETVQGEGGAIPADIEWLKELRRITAERKFRSLLMKCRPALREPGACFRLNTPALCPMSLFAPKP